MGVKSYEQYKKYSAGIHSLTPINLRDLLEFKKKNNPINIDEVEPVTGDNEKIWKWKHVSWCII